MRFTGASNRNQMPILPAAGIIRMVTPGKPVSKMALEWRSVLRVTHTHPARSDNLLIQLFGFHPLMIDWTIQLFGKSALLICIE